jgi:hypothetical protein
MRRILGDLFEDFRYLDQRIARVTREIEGLRHATTAPNG